MSNKFKIGDKVKLLKCNGLYNWRKKGEIGKVEYIDSTNMPYEVKFEAADKSDNYTLWCYEEDLELEQRKQPTKDEILKEVLSDIIKSYYPHLTNIEITIKSDIEIKL